MGTQDADSLDAEWLDVAAVNAVLDIGDRWARGHIVSIKAERIGVDFGFSGRVYRLHLGAQSDDPASLIAKFEHVEGIARAVSVRAHNQAILTGHIPMLFGIRIEEGCGFALILLEDISPATQGDDVTGCTALQAASIVRLISMLHASTWIAGHDGPAGSSTDWAERYWDQDRWNDRLMKASLRFPGQFDAATLARLSGFADEAADAHDRLNQGPRAWVHRDPHPDNAMWRQDGRLVMLDWSNAMVAPPAIDVAAMLSCLAFRPDASLSAQEVLTAYCATLRDNGLDPDEDEIRNQAAAAMRLLIRGSVGWAAKAADRDTPARVEALQAQVGTRTKSALRWLDE